MVRQPRTNVKSKERNFERGLDGYAGVQQLILPAGQVLIYSGHTPPGVFVFLSGCVRCGSRAWRNGNGDRPFLIPEPRALDHPLADSVVLEGDSTAVFVPRSIVMRHVAVRQLLQIIASGQFDPKLEQGQPWQP